MKVSPCAWLVAMHINLLLHQHEDHGHKDMVRNNKALSFTWPVNTMAFLLAYRVDESINSSSRADISYWAT